MISSDGVVQESRPVRKVMSKAKRAEITENFASMEDVVSARFDFNAVKDNKVNVDSAVFEKIAWSLLCAVSPPRFDALCDINRDGTCMCGHT